MGIGADKSKGKSGYPYGGEPVRGIEVLEAPLLCFHDPEVRPFFEEQIRDLLRVPGLALRCQTVRPDLTLRYVKDSHLNQTMGYLTECTFYAALFNRSPEGLPIDTVHAGRMKDGKPAIDPDGGPLKRTFSAKDRANLQRIAWEGLKQFQEVAVSTDHR